MSKFIQSTALFFIFALVGGVVSAQQKIAVVNIQVALLQSSYGKAEIEKLESSSNWKQLTTEFEGLRADLQALEADAQANGAGWDEEKKAEFTKQRQFLQADFELNDKKRRADQQAVVQAINATVGRQAQAALRELIEEESITLLLNQEAVLHATPVHDLTEKLAAKIKK